MNNALWPSSFTDKVVCVSGGAAGIGAAVVRAFAEAGASVVIADIDLPRAEDLAEQLTTEGGRAEAFRCDVSDEVAVSNLFARVAERYGRLDVVLANAGVEWTRDVRHTSLAAWQRVIAVNLTGVFLVCREALRVMCAQRSGVLLVTTSPHALATVPDAGAYAASKGGVHALMRALALEAAPYQVRVNALMPGTIDTPMVQREALASSTPELQLERMAASQPLGRMGKAAEVADAALFLASPAASFITGSVLSVDGGLMASLPSGNPISYRN